MFSLVIFINLCFHVLASLPNINNYVCSSYLDYYIKPISNNCWQNKDVHVDMPKLATQNNYTVETYEAVTKDGYKLTMYRLPQQNKSSRKGVVFLQHPATSSCAQFVDKGNMSLGFSLHKVGYEIWLGNSRGNSYSRKHISLKPSSNEFWNFSYHEMGIYDLPAQIELAAKISGADKMGFVGHSMSGSSAAIYAALLPEHAKKHINIFILMAPATFMRNIGTPLKFIAPFGNAIYLLASAFHQLEFLRKSESPTLCYKLPFLTKLCAAFSTWFGGWGEKPFRQLSPELIPVLFSHVPDGLSLKCVSHFGQGVAAGGKFRQYDYGKRKNLQYYNSTTPPDYPVHKIQVPVKIIAGKYDQLVSIQGMQEFLDKLPKGVKKYDMDIVDSFNHINFAYAKDSDKEINSRVKSVLKEYFS